MSYFKNLCFSPFADVPSEKSVLFPDYQHLSASLSKKKKLDIISEKHLANLSPSVNKRIDDLRMIQDQKKKLEGDLAEGIAELKAKYEKVYQRLYAKRCEIVNGVDEVEGVNIKSALNQEAAAKGVPNFWLIVLKNTQQFDELSYRDEQALQYLKDITSTKIDKYGFKLEFFFDPNPYFKNSVLSKTYYMNDEEDKKEIFGTAIDWLPSQYLTEEIMGRKHFMGNKDTKPIFETRSCLSFFNFFEPIRESIDENDANRIHNFKEHEFNIGINIRDKVIPKAVCWFTGDVEEDDFGESDAETNYGDDDSDAATIESVAGENKSEDEEDEEDMYGNAKKVCRSGSQEEQSPEYNQYATFLPKRYL